MIPTLTGGEKLRRCVRSLEHQTFRDFSVVVVQNGQEAEIPEGVTVIRNEENRGYGEAVNQGARGQGGEYIAALNDDTTVSANWLEAMVRAMEEDAECGMVAPRILLGETGRVDSAGMVVARDGSSRQRGHGEAPERWEEAGETLCASGCAGLYRRAAFEAAGGFDASFFLYCEETDLGLRLRWLGWKARYEPKALVRHEYSATAGRASARKAWYVERNRLRLVVKNFPWGWVAASFGYAAMRYGWHLAAFLRGEGKAGEFRAEGGGGLQLAWLVGKAHVALLGALPELLRQRRATMGARRMEAAEYGQMLRRYGMSLREVARH